MRRLSAVDRRSGSERGETLIELLITVMILGTAVVALVGGLVLAVRVSAMHREQATAGAAVRAFAEALQSHVAATPTGYLDCADETAYDGIYTGAPAGYVPEVTAVAYWNGAAFVSTCTTDTGVQRVSLRVTSQNASETLDVVLRKPCRQGETCV